jgi:PKHD-type hydroxylase
MKGYYFLNSFFDSSYIDRIIDKVPDDSDAWNKGTIRGEHNEGKTDTSIRNVDLAHIGNLRNADLSRDLMYVASQVNAQYFGYDIYDIVQMDLLKYQGGLPNEEDQFYDWHVDTNFWGKGSEGHIHRKITMIVQLSDGSDYEGGDLEFKDNTINQDHDFRAKGSVILFPAPWSHRITPVTKGLRRSLVAWVEGPAWR